MQIQEVLTPPWVGERTPDPPPTLWVRGDPTALHQISGSSIAIAVVGTRSASSYGLAVARSWSRALAKRGFTIISGLARGIDGEAHRGALEADNGVTIAVLGCGIDRDYPAGHAELARKIVESGGCIVSEYEPGIEPAPWRFPARNRIIAGLSSSCLVVEARERSGSLIAVDFAMECGSDIFAVPGEVTSALSNGTNRLIRDGVARLALSPDDVLAANVSF